MESEVNTSGCPAVDQSAMDNTTSYLGDFSLLPEQANGNLMELLMESAKVYQDPLPALSYNPAFSMQREANFRQLADDGKIDSINIRGANAVILGDLQLGSPGWPTEISDGNRSYPHRISPEVEQRISPHTHSMLSGGDIIALSKKGISGAHFRENSLVFEACGVPLQCVDVRFLRMPDVEAPDIYPFRAKDGTPLVPLVGGIMLGGEEITSEQAPSLPAFESDKGDPIRAPAFTHQGRALVAFGLWNLAVEATDRGGQRFASLGAGAIQQKPDTVPVVGWHFVGVGTRRYVFNPVEIRKPEGKLPLQDHELVLLENNTQKIKEKVYIQDTRYAGKGGIPLDRKHQRLSDSPTGGDAVGNTDVERDLLLWEHGAQMARVMCACFKIVDRDALIADLGPVAEKMVSESSYITAGPIFDDTHRLDMFFVDREDLTSVRELYDTYLKTEYGSTNETARLAHLNDLSVNMGTNLRVCLDLKFVNHPDQAVETNISRKGKLLDSGNFAEMESRFQALHMVFPALETIAAMSTVDGSSGKEYFASTAFESFLSAFLGTETSDELVATLRRRVSTGSTLEQHARTLSGRYTALLAAHNVALELCKHTILNDLKAEGKGYNLSALVNLFADHNSGLLLPMDLDIKQAELKKWSKSGVPDRVISKSNKGFGVKTLTPRSIYAALEASYVSQALSSQKFQNLPFKSRGEPPILEEVDRARVLKTSSRAAAGKTSAQDRKNRKKQLQKSKKRKRR
jgi:hypothetical protein